MNLNGRQKILLILSVMVVVMAIVKWKYGYKGENQELRIMNYELKVTNSPLPTPTEVILVTPTEIDTIDPDYPLWKLLPYSGKGFTVEKYLAPMKLEIRAKGLDKKLVKTEVEKWLESLGVRGMGHTLVIGE